MNNSDLLMVVVTLVPPKPQTFDAVTKPDEFVAAQRLSSCYVDLVFRLEVRAISAITHHA
jgi:hypothetical protein